MTEVKVLDLLLCSRPVLFYNDIWEYPYSVGGTAFVVFFQGRHFVLTARHVLNLPHFQLNQFRVQYNINKPDTIPLAGVTTLKGVNADDTDQYDVAVWEVVDTLFQPPLFGDQLPYALPATDASTDFNPTAGYLFRGFPYEGRIVDYDTRSIQWIALSGRLEYESRTQYAFLHRLHLANDGTLTNANGLSGSPVFQVRNQGRYSAVSFAGMLLRANTQTVYMLEHWRVIEILSKVCARA